jgi:hypothetical protein
VNLSCNFFRGSFDLEHYISFLNQHWLHLEKIEQLNQDVEEMKKTQSSRSLLSSKLPSSPSYLLSTTTPITTNVTAGVLGTSNNNNGQDSSGSGEISSVPPAPIYKKYKRNSFKKEN